MRCPADVCEEELPTLAHLKRHCQQSHLGENQYHCRFCSSEFGRFQAWRVHLSQQHPALMRGLYSDSSDSDGAMDVDVADNGNMDASSLQEDVEELDGDISATELEEEDDENDDSEALEADDSTNFCETIRAEILTSTSRIGITESETDKMVDLIRRIAKNVRAMNDSHFDQFMATLNTVATSYRRKAALRQEQDYIEPLPRQMGTMTVPVRDLDGKQSRVDRPCKFYIVPLKDSIEAAFRNVEFQQVLEMEPFGRGNFLSPLDGQRFRDATSRTKKPLLPIVVYLDDVCPGSGLRKASSIHSQTMMFFTFSGLRRHASCLHKWKFLYATSYGSDHKAYGYKPLLESFKVELNVLYENGIMVSWRGRSVVVYPWLHSVLGDNLALNQVRQMQTCFSGGFPCRHCLTNYRDFGAVHLEKDCQLRTLAWYQANGPPAFGVMGDSPLNGITGYHVSEDAYCDIAHDLYEGESCRLLGVVIRAIIRNGLPLKDINDKLCAFATGRVDSSCTINPIPADVSQGDPVSGQKAADTAFLIRLVPFLFPLDVMVAEPEIRLLFQRFSELSRLLCSFELTSGDIDLVRSTAEEYVSLAWRVVPLDIPPSRAAAAHSSRPIYKTHALLHYAAAIRSLGPVGQLSTLQFEQLNAYVKRRSYITRNFTCLPCTFATHIQRTLWALRLQKEVEFVPGKGIEQHQVSALARAVLKERRVKCTLLLQHHGTLYKSGDIVLLNKSSSFVPAQIDCFAFTEQTWKIVAKIGHPARFDDSRQCCFFTASGAITTVFFKELFDPLPLDGYPEGNETAFMPRHALCHC